MILTGRIIFAIFLLMFLSNCTGSENTTANYFNDAELQYEGNVQKENIMTALNDILTLPEEELKNKRYKDYTGKINQWDLETLIYKHFIPDNNGKTLGNNFYHDIKSEEVKKQIKQMMEDLQKRPD